MSPTPTLNIYLFEGPIQPAVQSIPLEFRFNQGICVCSLLSSNPVKKATSTISIDIHKGAIFDRLKISLYFPKMVETPGNLNFLNVLSFYIMRSNEILG
jgi:hypothetical protein